jgi:hypothetical protein
MFLGPQIVAERYNVLVIVRPGFPVRFCIDSVLHSLKPKSSTLDFQLVLIKLNGLYK